MRTLALFVILLVVPVATSAEEFVRVSGSAVNVRVDANTRAPVIVQAREGDVFEVGSRRGAWVAVVFFSGEHRWIHGSLLEAVQAPPPLPASATSRRAACIDSVRAEDRATAAVESLYRTNWERAIVEERVLTDRYKLEVFQRHGIAPARYTELAVQCVQNDWLP